MWSSDKERTLRAAVEQRFRSRTPAKDVLDVDWKTRVPRSEVRALAIQLCGESMPDTEEGWNINFASWYRSMARRVIRQSTCD